MTMKDVDVSLDDDQPEGEAGKSDKTEKNRLVRDSFTIPKAEYSTLNELKNRATALAQPAKKSELLRAGIALLKGLSDAAFKDALAAVPNLKTGRPPKDGEEGAEGAEPKPRVGRKIIDKIEKSGSRAKPARAKAAGGAAAAKPARGAAKANKTAKGGDAKAEKPTRRGGAAKPARPAKAAKGPKAENPAKAAKLAARNKTAG